MTVEIKHISKFYGRQKALDNVSFTTRQNELLGFLGPNGAGKSTLMKIITGFLQADDGEVRINGEKVAVDNVDIKSSIGYLPENNPLYPDLYVPEFLDIAAGFYKIGNRAARIKDMIALTGLEREKHKKIGALSKGYRQRVGLAQALIHDPSVLILDEPTTGLDPNQLGEIRALISSISREKTVIFSSHIMQEIEAVCSRVVIINQGKLVADSEISNLKSGFAKQAQKVAVLFDKEVSAAELCAIESVDEAAPEGEGWLLTATPDADVRPEVFRFAVATNRIILSLFEKQQNLENIFRELTN
ncbi:MAG: ATP-binding cassette domain-containing protein [Prolixibacteraceae bacterium]|nr:ATP-binding cassette domain-containing protein [Prolixibacteraceae bacterium]